jgi:hypothetical protein
MRKKPFYFVIPCLRNDSDIAIIALTRQLLIIAILAAGTCQSQT